VVCFLAVEVVKHRFRIDDSLDVFAVHGVGGILGSLLVAVLAAPALGGAGYAPGVTMAGQAGVQALGVVAVVAWSALVSFAILAVVKAVIGLRAGDLQVEDGLDVSEHGERAYPA
jgi:Amt family ammonium transporter